MAVGIDPEIFADKERLFRFLGLRRKGLFFVVVGLGLLIAFFIGSVPERSAMVVAEGKIVDITRDGQDLKSDMSPASKLHIRNGDGDVQIVRVQAWRLPPAEVSTFRGKKVRALYHGGAHFAYELDVEGIEVINYATVVAQYHTNRPTLPMAGVVGLGVIFILIDFWMLRQPPSPPRPTSPARPRRPAPAGRFGRR